LQRSNGGTVLVLVLSVVKGAMAARPAKDTAAVAEAVTVLRADDDDDDVVPVVVAAAVAVLVSPWPCSGQPAALAVASSPASPVQRLAKAHLRRRERSGWRGA